MNRNMEKGLDDIFEISWDKLGVIFLFCLFICEEKWSRDMVLKFVVNSDFSKIFCCFCGCYVYKCVCVYVVILY